MNEVNCTIVGTCVADILVRPVPLSSPFEAGKLLHVEPIEITTGGIVCNTGIAMRRLGMEVAASSLVGNDQFGDFIRSRLGAEGIETSPIATHRTLATSTTAVLIDSNGERSFAHHAGAPAALDTTFLKQLAPFLQTSRSLVIGYVGLLPALEPSLADSLMSVRSTHQLIAVETGGNGGDLAHLTPAFPSIDVFVPSLEEASQQTGFRDPREILGCYRGLGARGLIGVKLGVQGTVLSPTADEILSIPCIPPTKPITDTTGAGDCFLAGLLTGLIRGMTAREAGLLGAATAACCVTGVGATAGLCSFDETLAMLQKHL
jgi:sugar/nucleoside kinase (ribokinase family)